VPSWLLPTLITIAVILLISFPLHEFAHAWTADRLGDRTPRAYGRLTLDPRAHFDPLGGSLLILTALVSQGGFMFGWAKTPIVPAYLRGGARAEAVVALAGPVANLVIAAAAAIPLRFLLSDLQLAMDLRLVFDTLMQIVTINLLLMLFNLIPIPPLDGATVLFSVLDPRTRVQVRPFLQQYGFFILLALMWLPPQNPVLFAVVRPVIDAVRRVLVGA
jgi:Zn-dependent protease